MRYALALILFLLPASAAAQVRVCLPATPPKCLSDGRPFKSDRLLLQCRADLFLYRKNTLAFIDCLTEFRLPDEFDLSIYMITEALNKMGRAFDLWSCKAITEGTCAKL